MTWQIRYGFSVVYLFSSTAFSFIDINNHHVKLAFLIIARQLGLTRRKQSLTHQLSAPRQPHHHQITLGLGGKSIFQDRARLDR